MNDTYRLIIAGGRDFNNVELFASTVDPMLEEAKAKGTQLEIVSGMARGADKLGWQYAKARGLIVHEFPADWDRYGKSAGYRRNTQMAEFADGLLAFHDGQSRGTQHMINIANEYRLYTLVIRY